MLSVRTLPNFNYPLTIELQPDDSTWNNEKEKIDEMVHQLQSSRYKDHPHSPEIIRALAHIALCYGHQISEEGKYFGREEYIGFQLRPVIYFVLDNKAYRLIERPYSEQLFQHTPEDTSALINIFNLFQDIRREWESKIRSEAEEKRRKTQHLAWMTQIEKDFNTFFREEKTLRRSWQTKPPLNPSNLGNRPKT